jgi:hypothetical protein
MDHDKKSLMSSIMPSNVCKFRFKHISYIKTIHIHCSTQEISMDNGIVTKKKVKN